MQDEIIIFLVKLYRAYDRAVDELMADLKKRLEPVLEVFGAIIMATPAIGILLWLLGVR
ncbi:hypothetical protein AB1K62_06110 [Parasphingorhabdus sp. JC815]|uniref:hypothetical protein n=1 Tax=Parasphingorhabdus sp. JC815 TaxID=3232140 RepID=UPI003457DA0C